MTIFDAQAIEAAAKVNPRHILCDKKPCKICLEWATAALSAAEASMRARSLLREGQGYHDADGGEAWDATTGGFREPGGFPVVIIKRPTP